MEYSNIEATKEKRRIALTSVFAAIFLTGIKLTVGLLTGSLGILSEALHSGLDLVAALMTFFSVKIASKPADNEHHFGHGKAENISALFQTILLLFTCYFIIDEAVSRLISNNLEIDVTFWSFAVIVVSIIVDISRSRALMRVAKKYDSQALEADALHFSTDILSSAVVIIGLVGAMLGFNFADSVAALVVALIVIVITYKLGKRAVDELLDKSPEDISYISDYIKAEVPEVIHLHDIRIRKSGANTFVELNIHLNPKLSIEEGHDISHKVSERIKERISHSEVHVHIEPDKKTEIE